MVKDDQEHGAGAEQDGKNKEIVVGNHGDGDAVLSVWTVMIALRTRAGSLVNLRALEREISA